jgi:HEAT repeat protein
VVFGLRITFCGDAIPVNAPLKSDDFFGEALQKTFHVLATTSNACAEATLISALDSRGAEIVSAAARAILVRNSVLGQEALLEHWPTLKGLIAPVMTQFPGRMVRVLTKRLENLDLERAQIAMSAAVEIFEFDLIPKLLPHAENRRSAIHKDADSTLLALVKQLFDETHGRRTYVNKRDPQLARSRVVNDLENSLGRFEKHRSTTILTCFFTLAGRDNAHVVRLLSQSTEGGVVQQEVIKLLRTSDSPGVMKLLASFLDDPSPPLAGLQLAAERTDSAFVEECLKRIANGDQDQLGRNLKRISNWAWLEKGPAGWKSLYEGEQSAAVAWLILSGIDEDKKLATLEWVLNHGRVGARIRAAEALENLKGDKANSLVQGHLGDDDPRVRAALLSQLRVREIPGALSRLIASLVDTDPVVRKAVQKQLPEFKFRRYLDLFDSMDPEVQQANGKIVKRVDPDWRSQLEGELKAEMRLRRLRGLRIANCMEAGNEVYKSVLSFATDEEALTRQEAIAILGQSDAPEAIDAIRQALLDPQVIVRRAAEEVLKTKRSAPHRATASILAPPALA